jgi:pimeloyl-ACP methyl ester carboxylesterase
MDVRGHGESSTAWADFSVAAVGSDIIALARHLDAGPAVILGDSMGGGAAAWAAYESPEWVRGIVLIDPFVRGDKQFFLSLLFTVMFSRPWGAAMWAKFYRRLYPTRQPEDFAAYTAALQANLALPGRLEALQKMLGASKQASEERLAYVRQPAIVLMGTKDPDFKNPQAEAAWVADKLNAQYTMIPNAGHYPHAEMPAETAALILAFLQQLAAQGGGHDG